jgi:hypothetical protein
VIPVILLLLLILSYPFSHWMALQPWWVQCNVVVMVTWTAFWCAGRANRWRRGP